MDKIKIFLNKNFSVIASIGIIILVVIASVAMYKEYLISKILKKYMSMFSADMADFDTVDKILFESKMRNVISNLSIKRLHDMNSLDDYVWTALIAKAKLEK